MRNKIINEINEVDSKITEIRKQMENIAYSLKMKEYCIEIIRLIDIRYYLVDKLKEQDNGKV